MQKPLDPMSVERTETPSASYVLRRRYGRSRHVITVASWVTVISMLLQPVAALATTYYWDSDSTTAGFGNTTGTWGTSPFWSTTSDGTGATDNTTITTSDTVNFGTASLNYGGTAVGIVAGGVSVGSIVYGAGQTTGITLGTAGNAITIHGGITVNNGAGAQIISSPITLGANQTWANNSANTLTVSSLALSNKELTVGGTGNTTITASGTFEKFNKNDSGTVELKGTFNFNNGSNRFNLNGDGTTILSGTITVPNTVYTLGGNPTLSLVGSDITWTGTFYSMRNAGQTNVLQIRHDGGGGSDGNITPYSSIQFQQYEVGTTTIDVDRIVGGTGANKTVQFSSAYVRDGSTAGTSTWNFQGGANGYGISMGSISVPTTKTYPLVLNATVPVTFTSASSLGTATSDMTGSSTVTFNGALNGGGASAEFNQNGTGTTVLAGGGAFNGAINVKKGTLLVNGTSALGTGGSQTVTVGGAGTSGTPTLGGTGTINRPVTIAAAGTGVAGIIAPGVSGSGTLTLGSTALSLGGKAQFTTGVSGTNTKIAGISTLTYGGILQISASNLTVGNNWDLFDFASQSGAFDNNGVFGTQGDGTNLPLLGAGLKWMFNYSTGVLSVEWAVTSTSYSLAAARGDSVIHVGGNTTVTATIRNEGTGTDDELDYTGLTANSSIGNISGSTSGGGPLGQGVEGSNSGLTFNGTLAGTATITPVAATAVNHSLGGDATLTATTPVTVGVFSGDGSWTAGSGSWGSGANVDWTDDSYATIHAAPGTFATFTGQDAATFAVNQTATVSLNGALPDLNRLVFSGGTYTLAAGTGGLITIGGTTPLINVTGGSGHGITANVALGAATECAVAGGVTLNLTATVTGAHTLTKTGNGTLAGKGTMAGSLTVNAGVLEVTDANGERTVASLTMNGGSLKLTGSGVNCGKVTSTGAIALGDKLASLTLVLSDSPTETEYILVSSGTGLTGEFSNYANNAPVSWGGKSYKLTYTATQVKLVLAPGGTVIMFK